MPFYQKTPWFLKRFLPQLTWEKKIDSNSVFLTFDDGPHPEITPWVISELNKYNFHATFFCVGQNVEKYPEVVFEIERNGHSIGNHTMNHIKGWNHSLKDYEKNIMEFNFILETPLFRPPYGRITPKQIKYLKHKFQIIMWSLLSCDYLPDLNIQESLNNLKKQTKAGSIIVFHDSIKAEKNLKILLPLYLEFLKENGFVSQSL